MIRLLVPFHSMNIFKVDHRLLFSFYLSIAVFRRAPDSFTDQRYHSWMAYDYKAKDGVPRYAKFRLIPADGGEETGLMTEYDQRKP